MGNAETTQQTAAPTMTIPSPAPAPEAMAAPQQGVDPARFTPRQPLLEATTPGVAGLKTIPDLRLRRLIGVSAWALALGSAGFVLGAVALIRLMGDMPGWFEPVFAGTGVFGLALVIAAFVTVQYRLVPWLLLTASSVTFIVGVVLLASA